MFTVSLTSGGNYTVTLLDQVDHLPNSPANDDNQALTIDLSGVGHGDGRGRRHDPPRRAARSIVQIEDDVPVAHNDTDDITGGGTTATGNVITGADTTTGVGGATRAVPTPRSRSSRSTASATGPIRASAMVSWKSQAITAR